MDTLWWGSVFVFGGRCVAAVRTGANKDSAYGENGNKRGGRSAESVGGGEGEGREEIERRERERASSR